MINTTTLSIIGTLILFALSLNSTNDLFEFYENDSESSNVIVVQNCTNTINDTVPGAAESTFLGQEFTLDTDCNGAEIHCRNNVWRCHEHETGMFNCCHMPDECPERDKTIGIGD